MKKTSTDRRHPAPAFSLLGQQPAPPPPPTEDALAALLAQITALAAGLLPYYQLLYKTPLTTTQRKALAVLLPKDPRALVQATVLALLTNDKNGAPLFADLPIHARTLGLSQDIASALQLLANQLGLLHRLCRDACLEAQAGAVEQARQAIAAIEHEPPSDLRRKQRRLAMATPKSLDPPKRGKALKSERPSSRTEK